MHTFILIPGAGGGAWYWHLVVPRPERRGHEAIPRPLPAGADSAGLADVAEAVIRAIGERQPQRVVLVAQSMAGFTVPLVCQRARVGMVILVNAMIPNPGETPGAWWANTDHREAKRLQNVKDGRPADAPFDPRV